ncbi:MAG: DUF1318 domain-containing protein [Candidatus Omnitrophota bacterium]
MKKTILVAMLFLSFSLGCARVKVEGSKEPIKVDISMRLDIYQHVAKDIDDIESIVSGTQAKPEKQDTQSSINLFVGTAFAQDSGLSPEVEQAALRRKDRRSELASWQEKGALGENKSGLVEIKGPVDASIEALVKTENKDRMVIYEAVAEKNGTSTEAVQKLYAKRLQDDAPSGTPIEAANETGNYVWRIK